MHRMINQRGLSKMTIQQISDFIIKNLSTEVGVREAKAMRRILLEDLAGKSEIEALINPDKELEPELCERIENAVERIVRGEPIQYVVGSAYFHGLHLNVEPGVLIPRPETSQLVDIITDRFDCKNDLRVLDVGTGSGAIAVALSRSLPFCQITAIDISPVAIKVAESNCQKFKIKNIRLFQQNILKSGLPDGIFDIIVSNPPYVVESEKDAMEDRVVKFEPEIALFVPDKNPLVFYRKIAMDALNQLSSGGTVFFEINPRYSSELKNMMQMLGFSDIEIQKDMNGKDRFLSAIKRD